jgi:hypothetical protein
MLLCRYNPQILLFARKASIVRKSFVEKMSGWIEALAKKEEDWDACRSVFEGHTDYVSAVVPSKANSGSIEIWHGRKRK